MGSEGHMGPDSEEMGQPFRGGPKSEQVKIFAHHNAYSGSGTLEKQVSEWLEKNEANITITNRTVSLARSSGNSNDISLVITIWYRPKKK